MKINPNFKGNNGPCVYIDMWDDEKLKDNALQWDILYKMDELLSDVKIFKENAIKGPRMYSFPHEVYNSDPNIIAYLESAFSQAYDLVMARTVPATKDAKICDLKNENRKLTLSLEQALVEIRDLKSRISDLEDTIDQIEESNEVQA